MNLGLISREYPPFFGGGIGTYTRQFARALALTGHRPVVITVSDDGTERREEDAGITVVRLPFLKGNDWSAPHPAIATPETLAAFRTFHPVSAFAMQVAAALPRLVAEFALEGIEAADTGALAWFALNSRRTGRPWPAGVPLTLTVHSPSAWVAELNGEPVGPREAALIAMEGDCAAWAEALVCPSETLARWAEPGWALPHGSITTIPYALGDLEPVAQASLTADHRRDAARILFVGRLEPRKGLETLLPALSAAAAGSTALRLDLCGQDMPDPRTRRPLGTSLVDSLDTSARARVTRHGRLPPQGVAGLRAACRVAVVPSPTDNYPFSCIEAMAAGQVVVAAAAGGMREMIRDGVDGLLFPPGDAVACAAALLWAASMTDAEAAAMGRSAAARILDLCGNERTVTARVEHFRRAVAGVRPLPPLTDSVIATDPRCTGEAPAALAQAVCGDIGFAHGWTRDSRGIVGAFTTPAAALDQPGPPIGPLAIARSHAERLGLAPAGGIARVPDTRGLAAQLLGAGVRGAVVPNAVSGVRAPSAAARFWRRLAGGAGGLARR